MFNPQESPLSSTLLPFKETEAPPEIQAACEDTLALHFHSFNDAIKQADDLCSKHNEFSIVHLTRGQLLGIQAQGLHDSDKNKRKLLKDALESLQHAVNMLPQSPVYAYFLAYVLLLIANLDHQGYRKVVQECERALSLDINPDEYSSDYYQSVRLQIQELITLAHTAEQMERYRDTEKKDVTAEKKTKLIMREKDRKLKCDQDFIKKTGDYWCNLRYEEKCRIIDVKIKDLESFFRSGKNKNLKALSILNDAVELYKEKGHWITGSCCICDKDIDKEDCEIWSSLEKHIDIHFADMEPKVEGTSEVYEVPGNFESLEFDHSNGVFNLHKVLDKDNISGVYCNTPLTNNNFLVNWLRKESDVKLALELWEKRREERSKIGLKILETILKLKDDLKKELTGKEAQETADDTLTDPFDESGILEAKILAFKHDAVRYSAHDYRKIVLVLLKSFIQARLECLAEEEARKKAEEVMAELIMDQSLDNKNMPTKSKSNKSKKKKGNKNTKVAGPIDKKLDEGQDSVKEDNEKREEGEFKEGSEFEAKEETIQENLESNMQHEIQALNGENKKEGKQPSFYIGEIPIYMNDSQNEQDEETDEEKKLEKKVQHQRQYEEEMKAKRLAEQLQQLEPI